MSIDIQKQIKDNSRSVSDYFQDLIKWEEEETKKEQRRECKKSGIRPNTAKKPEVPPPRGSDDKNNTEKEGRSEESIARDKLSMPRYYHDWEGYDAEAQVEKLELQEEEENRRRAQERQAEKDSILDELAYTGDGDRVRTSKARPRVKVSVRVKGRRLAPVDLAKAKKEEANNYFAQGRYKEAMVAYSGALDYLEKYLPPGEQQIEASECNVDSADGAGEETEALELKTTLLANRAQALIKIEEWREAIEDCDEALRFDPTHHKATLRRGFALAKQKRWSAAACDLARAVANDPSDRKAAAELQMARRNLAEQAKEVRAHAKTIICDATRDTTMPTRKLTVKVRRPDSGYGEKNEIEQASVQRSTAPVASVSQPQPRGARGEATVATESEVDKTLAEAKASTKEGGAGADSRVRQPYIPRSVRIRGQQPVPDTSSSFLDPPVADSTTAADGVPVMNFYTFEAQWSRNQRKPRERMGLLQRIGAAALPSLFRESLDAELVGSIISVLCSDLKQDSSAAAVSFACSVMGALSKCQRFEASLEALSADEHDSCKEVLSTLERWPQHCNEDLGILRQAFEPVPSMLQVAGQDDDEDDEDDYLPDYPQLSTGVDTEVQFQTQEATATSSEPVAGVSVISLDLDGCD